MAWIETPRRLIRGACVISAPANPGAGPAQVTLLLQTLRLLAACAGAYAFSAVAGFTENYWALITAVVVTQPEFEETLAASRNRVLGTVIGAAMGTAVLAAAGLGWPKLPLFWGALLPLAMLTAARPTLRLSCITLAIVVLIPSGGPVFQRPAERVAGILIGVAASILAAALIRCWPDAD